MKDFNIILDLDQTLISAEAEEDYDFNKNKNKAKLFNFKDMDGYYIVFERPNLQSFLDYVFENFNVSVWTAASKDYALFIIEKIILCDKPERKLDWIFFSYHCDISKKITKHTKDLSMLWDIYKIDNYEKDNTLIIDDYDEVYHLACPTGVPMARNASLRGLVTSALCVMSSGITVSGTPARKTNSAASGST